MAASDKERARAYRERLNAKQEELKQRGVMLVKVLAPGVATAPIQEMCEQAVDVWLGKPQSIDPSDLRRTSASMKESFLKCGAPQMVVFQEGPVSIGVKMIPNRSIPNLISYQLSDVAGGETLSRDKFPLLKRVQELQAYTWATPEYQELCEALGLDADWHRPQFTEEHDSAARDLMKWHATYSMERDVSPFNPIRMEISAVVVDFIEIIRTDPHSAMDSTRAARNLRAQACVGHGKDRPNRF